MGLKLSDKDFIKQTELYRSNPVVWAEEVLGVKLWEMQKQLLMAIVDNDVVVKSGNGLGKDFLSGVLVLWFLRNFEDSIVITSAPCFDEQTELLTKDGWKGIKEIVEQKRDKVAVLLNGQLTYETPKDWIKSRFKGDLMVYDGRDIEFEVTPNHRCFVRGYSGDFKLKEASEIYNKTGARFNKEVRWIGKEDGHSVLDYEFWGFWFADGSCRYSSKKRRAEISICQSKYVEYADKLTRKFASRYGKKVFRYGNQFVIFGKEIAKFFKREFNQKQIPSWIRSATKDKLAAFVRGFMMGDGSFENGRFVRTRIYDKKFADDFYEICIKAGFYVNLNTRELLDMEAWFERGKRFIKTKAKREYDITFLKSNKKYPMAKKKHWSKKYLDGFVYCVTTNAGIVMTRKNGKYSWSGNSERQVKRVIWGEIAKLYNNAKVPLGGKLMSTELRIDTNWYAIGFTTKETNQMIGKAQGFHAPHQLAIITEAQAVDETIYEQLDGVLTSHHSRKYIAGNPLMNQGYFWKLFNDPKVGANFKKFTFSCYDAPNVIEGREVFPGMVSAEWVRDREKRWGKDSPMFEARVLGKFPTTSVRSLVSMDELQHSLVVDDEDCLKGVRTVSVDPARYGDDASAFATVEGARLIDLDSENGKATTETEEMIISKIRENDAELVVIDEGAFGAGIFDHVEKELAHAKTKKNRPIKAYAFNFGGRSSDEKFANLGTEAWWKVCELIKNGKAKLLDDLELFSQLSSRRYKFNSLGQIALETKEEIKRRGLPSPDKADAVIMAIFMAIDEEKEEQEIFDYEDEPKDFDIELDLSTGYPLRKNDPIFL